MNCTLSKDGRMEVTIIVGFLGGRIVVGTREKKKCEQKLVPRLLRCLMYSLHYL